MAQAKQCDRCGAFYVETEPTAFRQLIKNAADTFKYITGANEKEQTRQIIESVVDLCPDCSNSLDKWLNQKEKDNILQNERFSELKAGRRNDIYSTGKTSR